jgi:hypothetical protein
VNPARPSLMDLPSPSESFASEPPGTRPVRRPVRCKGSPHELLGPFSTSRREDSPARGSRPTVVRLRRWFDLGGLLPSRPCRLVSSGGTLGVPDRPAAWTPPEGGGTWQSSRHSGYESHLSLTTGVFDESAPGLPPTTARRLSRRVRPGARQLPESCGLGTRFRACLTRPGQAGTSPGRVIEL